MKKTISVFLIAAMIIMVAPDASFASVIAADTPTDTAGLLWKTRLGAGYSSAPTYPLVSGDHLYVCTNDRLYKLNKNTGSVISQVALAGKNSFALVPPAEDGKNIYVPIGTGRIQAFEKNTLRSLWVSKKTWGDVNISGQTVSHITCKDGKVYTGTWGDGGQYFCIDTNTVDGSIKWAYDDPNGFYWAGAYVDSDYVVFGTDSVNDDSSKHSQIISLDNDTGEVKGTVSAQGSVRGPIESGGSGKLYAATKGKRLYKLSLGDDGSLIKEGETVVSGESTGGPTIHNGKVYVGTSSRKIDVIDSGTLSNTYSMQVAGYPQGGILIADRSDSRSYLYTTYNMNPGGLSMAELGDNSASIYNNFFIPTDRQSGISSIAVDPDRGTLYYKNDSGYLMAVGTADKALAPVLSVKPKTYDSLVISWGKAANATGYILYRSTSKTGTYKSIGSFGAGSISYTDVRLKTGTNYYYKIRAKYTGVKGTAALGKESPVSFVSPVLSKPKIKTKKQKKAVKITWNRVSGASGYVIYRATKKNGKYKKVKTVKKGSTRSWVNKKLKSKKKYYYKIRAYRNVSGKKVYSVYSNKSYAKTK